MKFGYPPFKVLIKISREGKPAEVTRDMEILADQLADYHPTIFPAFISEVKGKYRMHALIKIPAQTWVDARLLAKLKELSPDFIVDVEPESIL
jgi:primosomal protein N'